MTLAVEQLKALAEESGFNIADETTVPSRTARYSPLPNQLHPEVRALLQRLYPKGLYSHQADGLRLMLDQKDVCLATSTASGKSLVFMAAATHNVKSNPRSRVLALYPAKALIQDQLTKWRRILEHFGMEPGYIDGAIPTDQRPAILASHRVMLMTPDVAHAWLMSHLDQRDVRDFLSNLHLLILDEAHVYDGVFGTNMAYFIRRLRAVSSIERIISSTATIGEPSSFIERLTGRAPSVLADESEGSARAAKHIIVARPDDARYFDHLVTLVTAIARAEMPRFLAFADSRKMVEQLVAIADRGASKTEQSEEESSEDGAIDHDPPPGPLRVLPYRAGYEEDDRQAIQRSLANGELAGVVSTSALELGLDIGEVGVVLLLKTPPSVKSFWQRVGRAGRATDGVCLVIDDQGVLSSTASALSDYLRRPAEPGWLYLDNPYIQYAHALCAAVEVAEGLAADQKALFGSLPPRFVNFLENELNPTESVPDELYSLKQRAQEGPHYEFPLRTGIEKNLNVRDLRAPNDARLGTLSFSQALREGYPGAIYYYMARPYRVYQFNYRLGEIRVQRERRWTTQPYLQSMVFPKFPNGVMSIRRSDDGFVAETEMQVSERILGFYEHRGSNKIPHVYGPGSPHAQRPLGRFFETTGVCWYFRDRTVISESVAQRILVAFCSLCGIQDRDVGFGLFHAKPSPIWDEQCQGICIYDAVHGSLRLTSQLMFRFTEVVETALQLAAAQNDDRSMEVAITALAGRFAATTPSVAGVAAAPTPPAGDWTIVIGPQQRAMHLDESGQHEVEVVAFRYTPRGPMYQLVSRDPSVTWMVAASTVIPINGVTEIMEMNLIDGTTRPVS